MTKANNYIKYTGILYTLTSLLFYSEFVLGKILIMIIGLWLLACSLLPAEEVIKNKNSLIIIAIISTIINPISAIFLFLAIDAISSLKQISNNSPPQEKVISSESKRIDLLLKIGVAMILISGILFSTTSWNAISNLAKVISLIILAIIFIGLSKFSEIKLKIPSTTKVYYILGLSFFLLTWIGIGYFGVLSEWFSYFGAGKLLVYSLTFTVLSIILYLISNKLSKIQYQYLGHISCIFGFFSFLLFFKFSIIFCVLILSLISIVTNLLPSKNSIIIQIKSLITIMNYIYWPLIVANLTKSQNIVILIAATLNIINTLYISRRSESTLDKIYAGIISNILLVSCSLNLITSDKLIYIILFAVTTLYSLIIKYIDIQKNKWLSNINQILYHIISLIIILFSIVDEPLSALIIATIYLIYNIISSLNIKTLNNKIDSVYNPLVIFLFVCSLTNYINEYFFEVNYIVNITATSIIYTLVNLLSKNNKTKNYYLVIAIISIITTFLLNLEKNAIISFILVLLSIYIFLSVDKSKDIKQNLAYIFILLNINSLCSNILPGASSKILMISILGLISLVCQNQKYKTINYFAIIFPLLSLIYILEDNYIANTISSHILLVYILFLISKFIIKKDKTNDTFMTICLIISLINLVFKQELFIGIYIGILSIFIIYLTYNKDEYKKLFYSSITIMIINIIVQLWEFWAMIPFWLYLLLVGISIIAFVTYKEVKKEEVSNGDKTKQIEDNPIETSHLEKETETLSITGHQRSINFCPACGQKNSGGKFCGQCGKNLSIK